MIQGYPVGYAYKEAKGPGRGWWGPPRGTHGAQDTSSSAINASRIESLIPNVSEEDDDHYLSSRVEDIAEQMRDKYGDYDEDSFEEKDYAYVKDALTDWAIESDRGEALFLQKGVMQELKTGSSSYIDGKIRARGGDPSADFTEERQLARLIYDNTQTYLRSHGFKADDTVQLWRGSSRRVAGKIISNPLEAWTTSKEKAQFYVSRKKGGVVLGTTVSVRNIFALPQTGLGLPSVKEVVILGSKPHIVSVVK